MKPNNTHAFVAATALVLLSACASAPTADLRDPYEHWNRKVQSFNDGLDGYVLKPVAKGYRWVMPSFVDQGVSNFFSNLGDIGVIANDALQGKFSQAGTDGTRLLVNTTAGVGGLVDVATMVDLPKHKESFDKTLGVWGLGTGSYLVLPLLGPSSTRGIAGTAGDMAFSPFLYVNMPTAVPMGLGVLSAIDKRADNLAMDKIVAEAATDRYTFFKNAYLSRYSPMVEIEGNQEDTPLKTDEIDKK
jgi:phospholipid-binding lipoprotein MlaA